MSTVPHRMVLYRWIKYNYNVSGVIIHRKNYQDCANRVTFDEICKLAAIGYIIVNSIKASSFQVFTYQKLSCLDRLQRAKFSFDEGKKGSVGRPLQCFKLSLVSSSVSRVPSGLRREYRSGKKSQDFKFTTFFSDGLSYKTLNVKL